MITIVCLSCGKRMSREEVPAAKVVCPDCGGKLHVRQYGREDVVYQDWYGTWARELALNHTAEELRRMLAEANGDADHLSRANLNTRNRATDRAQQTWNAASEEGQRAAAITAALEIHELFPEFSKRKDEGKVWLF